MKNDETIVAAFSEEQVERLTGISKNQLRYWDRTDFFKPAFAAENRRTPFSRIYSFKDVASLRVLHVLRNQYRVPLQHLRAVAKQLPALPDAKWTSTELFVIGRRVAFVEPGSEQHREIVSKQYVLGIPLNVVASDTRRDVERLSARAPEEIGQVSRSRNVAHNAWVLAGTRIPVATIKRFAADGFGIAQILKEYPRLTEADVRAALAHEESGAAA